MSKQTIAYIGLGSNLGDRQAAIGDAVKKLTQCGGIEIVRTSSLIETPPLGNPSQPKYINAVAEINTSFCALDLYKNIAAVETSLGRVRGEKWSPRVIDIDLLLFGDEIINLPELTVPHRQMHLRSFVLNGLCQLNSTLIHPLLKESMAALAARLNGGDFAINSDTPQLISVAGNIGVGKTTLVNQMAGRLNCEKIFEPYSTNPFLAQVYAGSKGLALDSQLYFLTHRAKQLSPAELKPAQIVLTDYVFEKEMIYAKRLLDAQQLTLYKDIYPHFAEKVTKPVLVIYLMDSAQNCLTRIHKRGRSYEQNIEINFLETLSSDHEQLFNNWKICPVIRLSMTEFDCTKDSDINWLSDQIRYYVA